MAIIRGTYVTRLSGKVGNVVYRNRGGENIASEKPASVKNPRSDAQQRQRMVFATVSAAYSAMKEICDHSFEGVTYGANSMAQFMRRNLSIMKSRTRSFNGKGNPYMIPNPFMVSRGSLPTIAVADVENSPNYQNGIILALPDAGITAQNAESITVQQFHDNLGIQVGDQITFLGVAPTLGGERISWENARYQMQYSFVYARLVFNPANASSALLDGDDINSANLAPESLNANIVMTNVSSASAGVSFELVSNQFENMSTGELVAAAVIVSRKSGQDWQRSTQMLVTSDDLDSEWTDESMLPTYSPTGEKYLNNATV